MFSETREGTCSRPKDTYLTYYYYRKGNRSSDDAPQATTPYRIPSRYVYT